MIILDFAVGAAFQAAGECPIAARQVFSYNNNVFISYTIMVQLIGIVVELGAVGENWQPR